VHEGHRGNVGAGGERRTVRGHYDLNRALAVYRLVRALFQQFLDPLLQLRVKVCLWLLDKEKGEFITIAEQHQLGGHEESVVVAQAACAALFRIDAVRWQQTEFELLKDGLKS